MTETTTHSHIKVQVLNGSAVILNNGEEQHVTTGDIIYVPVPEGWHLTPPLELQDKGVPSREWLG